MKLALVRFGVFCAVLTILVLTLSPGRGGGAAPVWCVWCGDRVVADALRNMLLFAPFGLLLRWAGWPFRRVIGAAALLSLGVELAQTFIPGRDPSLGDVGANTLGAALAAWGAAAPAVRSPSRRQAAGMALLSAVIAASVLGIGRPLASPVLPKTVYYGQWVPQLGHLAWYGGSVRTATLGAMFLRDGPLDASEAVRSSLLAGDTLTVQAIAGPPSGALAPIFAIADDRGMEVLLLGADREDIVLRYRSRASALRLEQPSVRWPSALRGMPGGGALRLRLTRLGPDPCLEVNGHWSCPGVDPLSGWSLIVPEAWIPSAARPALGLLWLGCLVLPACYWMVMAVRPAR